MEKTELEHHCSMVLECVTNHLTELEVRLLWKANLDLLEACIQRHADWAPELIEGKEPELYDADRVIERCSLAISQLRQFFLKREEPREEERLQAEIIAAYLASHLPDAVGTE